MDRGTSFIFFSTLPALGIIGIVTDEVNECVLWALKYEEMPGVRAEACQALILLELEDVVSVLQDRLLVESDRLVQK